MKKKTIIIFTIISTLLSLAMIVFSYFGIIRYLSLHVYHKKLLENYSKLPESSEKKIIVSFAARPEDFDKLKPMLYSILDQTVKVDQIAAVVPLEDEKNVPEYITKIANIFPAGKDYGDTMALIPILLKEKECDTIIISLDHNTIYGKDFLETMIDEASKNEGTVLTDSKKKCLLLKPEYYGPEILENPKIKYDTNWFINKAKKTKIINYIENYTRI